MQNSTNINVYSGSHERIHSYCTNSVTHPSERFFQYLFGIMGIMRTLRKTIPTFVKEAKEKNGRTERRPCYSIAFPKFRI